MTQFYNLDMILSVGYRVNSKNAVIFRRWANVVLKEHLLRGFTLNHRFSSLEKQLKEHKLIIDDAVYLVGASIKDLGKKWFGFTLMENTDAEDLMRRM